jgi:8-oxo-dGTP pyrophosphatase MutT (NUDIX family)
MAIFRLFIALKAIWSPVAFGACGAIFDAQGRVLLVRHRYMAGWQLPGGGVDRGEPPELAVLRELGEEVGLTGGTAHFFGLYTRRCGWATNVVAVYRIAGGSIDFVPSFEISAILFADPHAPPPGCTDATLRRLAELTGATEISSYW